MHFILTYACTLFYTFILLAIVYTMWWNPERRSTTRTGPWHLLLFSVRRFIPWLHIKINYLIYKLWYMCMWIPILLYIEQCLNTHNYIIVCTIILIIIVYSFYRVSRVVIHPCYCQMQNVILFLQREGCSYLGVGGSHIYDIIYYYISYH